MYQYVGPKGNCSRHGFWPHCKHGENGKVQRRRLAWLLFRLPAADKEKAVNTTLIHGKALAEFDPVVLSILNLVPPVTHHPAENRLRIGIQNEQGDVYRVIKISGLKNFLDLIGKFRDLGFADEFAEHYGDKEGFDAIISAPDKSRNIK